MAHFLQRLDVLKPPLCICEADCTAFVLSKLLPLCAACCLTGAQCVAQMCSASVWPIDAAVPGVAIVLPVLCGSIVLLLLHRWIVLPFF